MAADKMVGYFHLIMILMLLVSVLECAANTCSVASCWPDDPPIRFPFWLKGHQPEHCGYPGFELSCSDINRTVINFPSSGQFTVADIVYGSQSILISDPEYCLPQRLMDFSVSETPFTLNNSLNGGFTLLSCEQTILGREVPCLSNVSRSILQVPATQAMTPSLSSCKIIGNIPNVADGSQLELNWDIPRCGDCEARGGTCALESNTSVEVQCFDPPRPPNFQQEHTLKPCAQNNKSMIAKLSLPQRLSYSSYMKKSALWTGNGRLGRLTQVLAIWFIGCCISPPWHVHLVPSSMSLNKRIMTLD